MSSTVTMEELIRRITGIRQEMLLSPCIEKQLWNIAKKLSEWRLAAPWLGFEQADVDAWERDARHDEEGKRHLMLTKWRQRNGSRATYKALAEVLLQVGRTDLAESLLTALKDAPTEASGSHHVFSSPPLPSSSHNPGRWLTPNYPHRSPFRDGTPSPCPTPPQPFSMSSTPFNTGYNSDTASPYGTLSPHPPVNAEDQQYISWGRGLPQPMGDHVAIPIQQDVSATSTFSATQCSTGYYYRPQVVQKVNSVCEQGSMAGLPSQSLVEMQHHKHRVQQLEMELQTTKNRYDREISHFKMEQESERREHQHMVQLLQQQLQSAQDNERYFQSLVGTLVTQLRQMEARFHNCEGTDCIDGGPDLDDNPQMAEHQEYNAVKTVVHKLRKEISVSLQVSSADSSDQHMTYRVTCTKREVFERLQSFQGLWEEKQKKMIKTLEKRRMKDVAMNSLRFLEANCSIAEVVSRSLECLSDTHCGGLGDDLRWLQGEFETLRFASWP